jgi:hypothetical protein
LDVIVAPRLMPYCIIKRISLYSIDALWQRRQVNCSVLSASRDVSATKSITNQVFPTVAI